ncbi:hypothetical protein KSAC_06650 [Komagataeibacter saccharivorans]|nr:hypothetical protein KSAC_06650 [Komagataeibacter saccharivorans]
MTDTTVFMNDLSCSERLLVWCVRRLNGNPHDRSTVPGLALPFFRADFAAVANAFHMALARLRAFQAQPVDVAICSATRLTRTENHFLAAAAAAQEGREAEVRRALRPVFLHHHVLSPFAAAITQLGACMAGAGYWLPRRGQGTTTSGRVPVTRLRWNHGRGTDGANAAPAAHAANGAHQPVGAGSLGTLRWHDADMASAHVMWPRSAALAQTGGV